MFIQWTRCCQLLLQVKLDLFMTIVDHDVHNLGVKLQDELTTSESRGHVNTYDSHLHCR